MLATIRETFEAKGATSMEKGALFKHAKEHSLTIHGVAGQFCPGDTKAQRALVIDMLYESMKASDCNTFCVEETQDEQAADKHRVGAPGTTIVHVQACKTQ